jgi:hypothetical protein
VESFFKSMEWPNGQRGWRPLFIVPSGNLPIGPARKENGKEKKRGWSAFEDSGPGGYLE